MFSAVCNKCGETCDVPFKPTGDKPVFCSNCFKQSGRGDSRRFGDRQAEGRGFRDKQMFAATCDACGNDCQVPFKPTSGKPVYCSNCFGSNKPNKINDNDRLKEELVMLNTKLDKILSILSVGTVKSATKVKVSKKTVKSKVKK